MDSIYALVPTIGAHPLYVLIVLWDIFEAPVLYGSVLCLAVGLIGTAYDWIKRRANQKYAPSWNWPKIAKIGLIGLMAAICVSWAFGSYNPASVWAGGRLQQGYFRVSSRYVN